MLISTDEKGDVKNSASQPNQETDVHRGTNSAFELRDLSEVPRNSEASRAKSQHSRGMALFTTYIDPLFKSHCYECHSDENEGAKGGLNLDSLHAILAGGDLGPALKPGDPDGSLILKAVGYEDVELQMPPDAKLSDTEIAHLREWI